MNETKVMGVAIVGAGAIATIHIDAFQAFPARCEVRAICDLFVEKAQQLIDENGLSARAYSEISVALAQPDIDIISICLPPSMHAPIALAALKAGKHVLVEKPMACSLEECDTMIAAAQESGRVLSVVCQNRYKTPYFKTKQLIDQGIAGDIKQTIVNSLWWRGGNYYDLWWRGTWEKECGGCMTSHAVHHLDLLQWMVGMPARITAVIGNVAHDNSECEDVGMAILEYPGMFAQVTASLVNHGEEQELVFQGDKGRISVPWKTASQKALPNGFPEANTPEADRIQRAYDDLPALSVEGHPAQIQNFLKAIDGEEPLMADGQEGRKTIELIMGIYKAAALRQTVTLPLLPEDPFYRKDTMTAQMPRFFEKKKSVENFAPTKITLGRDVGK